MRKAIYTAVTDGYDLIKEPKVVTDGWDYICFTDRDFDAESTWDFRKMDSGVLAQREKKINLLPDYDLTIWVDGSILINCDLNLFILDYCMGDFSLMKHPTRDCTYAEAGAVMQLGKADPITVTKQMRGYKKQGLPDNEGMVQTGVLVREHTDDVRRFCKIWWQHVKNKCHRDQLSFNFCLWKYPVIEPHLFTSNVLRDEFRLCKHLK